MDFITTTNQANKYFKIKGEMKCNELYMDT